MGASASMLEIDRHPELTQMLKEEYDRLSAEGYIDSQIEVQLRETYQDQVNEHNKKMKKMDLFARIQAANPTLKGVDISTSDVEMPKTETTPDPSKDKTEDSKRGSRINRRSFDNADVSSRGKNNANTARATVKTGGGARAVASTKAQRNANVDKRTTRRSFTGETSPVKNKNSQNQAKKTVNHSISTPAIGENVEENFVKPPTPKQQVEGKDFILLHEGPKLFWRQHTTLYIHIYLHVETDCVEVIGFNPEKFKEMNRSYLSYSILKTLTESVAVKRLEALLLEREEYGYRGAIQSEEELLIQEKEKAIVGHILDQMHLVKAENASFIEDFRYIPSKGTMETKGPEVTIIPEELSPVVITRRRHTNMDDVNKVFDEVMSVANDIVDAAQIGGHGGHVKNLMFFATENLGGIAKRAAKMRSMGYTKPRLKWIWAYNRVRAQIAVEQFTQRYNQFLEKFRWDNETKKYVIVDKK